jgi:hypothetical protein
MFVRIESLVTAGRSFRYAKFIGTMKLFFHLDFILCNSEHSPDDIAGWRHKGASGDPAAVPKR